MNYTSATKELLLSDWKSVASFFKKKVFESGCESCSWPEPEANSRLAAVLMLLFNQNNFPAILLTKRANQLSRHAGQVAFTGGHREGNETPKETALRESSEEIALPTEIVEVVGCLEPVYTVSNYSLVVPVVGLAHQEPEQLKANTSEVARIFSVTLSNFLDQSTYYTKNYMDSNNQSGVIHYFELGGETIWGATARMIISLLDAVDSAVNTC